MKILYLDFETSPIVGWAWRKWEADLFHIEQDVKIITVAWAVNDGPIYCMGVDDFKGYKPGIRHLDDRKLVEFFASKFADADYVVAQNGKGFDFKLWRTRLLIHGLTPHHEPFELDTKQWAKSRFYFTSNSQDNISRQLGTTPKMETEKHLHLKCIEHGDPKAWKQMKRYNKQDVQGLRDNAKRIAPHVTNLPNANVLNGTKMGCTNPFCKEPGREMQMRGPRQRSKTGKVQTYQCMACGKYATGPVKQTGVVLR